MDFQSRLLSDLDHWGVVDVGIGGAGREESRGVLSYGSKNSGVSDPVFRILPSGFPFIDLRKGSVRARF